MTFFIPDNLVLLGAKSMLLRQARRFLHHAGISPSETASNADLVASLVLFEALSADEAQALADQLVTHDIEAGDVMFEQGSDGASIYIIQAGVLELGRRGASSETEILGRVGPGEYIGELGLITGVARGVTMTALTHGRVLELPEESLRDLIQSNSALGVAMGRSVARGLALLDRDSAARSAAPEQGPDLLARIKAFFTQGAGAEASALQPVPREAAPPFAPPVSPTGKGSGARFAPATHAPRSRTMTEQAQIIHQDSDVIDVALNKLKKSPRNARRVPHSEADIEALAASIAVKGVLQKPVVEPETDEAGAPTGFYLVTIGEGRRFALCLLAKRKTIKKAAPVRCVVDLTNDPHEISLDENVTRTGLHPADEFEAFRRLSEERGLSAEEIGPRFGKSAQHVQQRLRLRAQRRGGV